MTYKSPNQIKKKLRETYSAISSEFSDSRSRPWPEFDTFNEFIPDGSKVLDLGCGNGRFYDYLHKQGKKIDYTGVDFCPEFLKIARKRYPQQEFIEQDITELDLPKLYDRIVSVATFHHLPSRGLRKKTLKLIFNQLEDDGIFMFSVWNLWQIKYLGAHLKAIVRFFTSFFRSSPRDLFIPFAKKKFERYYYAFFAFELRNMLRRSSFIVDKSEVSRHNMIFVCRKKKLAATTEAVFVKNKKFARGLGSSAVATFKKS